MHQRKKAAANSNVRGKLIMSEKFLLREMTSNFTQDICVNSLNPKSIDLKESFYFNIHLSLIILVLMGYHLISY